MVDPFAPDVEGATQPDPFDTLHEPGDPEGPDYTQRAQVSTFALHGMTVETIGRPLN